MELDCADKRAFLLVLLLRQPDYYTQLVQSVKYLLVGSNAGMGYRREVKAWFFMLHLPTPHHLSQKAKGASRCSLGRAKARPYTLSGVGWRARRSMVVAISR
jgi:hypothetical protein